MDCNPLGSSVHGILQARILDPLLQGIPFSRRSSQPRDQTQVSDTEAGFFTIWNTREAPLNAKNIFSLRSISSKRSPSERFPLEIFYFQWRPIQAQFRLFRWLLEMSGYFYFFKLLLDWWVTGSQGFLTRYYSGQDDDSIPNERLRKLFLPI